MRRLKQSTSTRTFLVQCLVHLGTSLCHIYLAFISLLYGKSYDYYHKYFELSEEAVKECHEIPDEYLEWVQLVSYRCYLSGHPTSEIVLLN